MPDLKKLRSSLQPSLLNYALIRGTLLAGAGGSFLLLAALFMPAPILDLWGFPIFIFSLALIAWGLLPYRKLRKIETNPHLILIDETLGFHVVEGNLVICFVPWSSIKEISWVEKKKIPWLSGIRSTYGALIRLGKNRDLKSQIPSLDKKCPSDTLFLPYFSFSTVKDLIEEYHAFLSVLTVAALD